MHCSVSAEEGSKLQPNAVKKPRKLRKNAQKNAEKG